jgi:hypothetical protein
MVLSSLSRCCPSSQAHHCAEALLMIASAYRLAEGVFVQRTFDEEEGPQQ